MKTILRLIFSLIFRLFSEFLQKKPGFVIFHKEIAGFFSSLTGYIVILVFVITNSLFMWVFPGEYNVLDSGYANLDTLFIMAPWVFLFLVPAVTMHMFSEERKTGTIELLFTRPVSNFQIIFSKYLAGISLVLFSLLPSFIYFVTVGELGLPKWNIDTGAFWGSIIGLFFLAGIYVSVGVFTSAITENQIVAFLLSMIIAFFLYMGFEAISNLEMWQNSANIINNLGINAHYKSMSRGVIDSRDVIYFVAVSAIFISLTNFILGRKE